MAENKSLDDKTFDELSNLASEKDVEGRSSMNKAELVDALSGDPEGQEEPKEEKPKATKRASTKKASKRSTSKESKYKEVLEEVAQALDRPSHNGHYTGCPAARSADSPCACGARTNMALKRKIESVL